VRSASPSSGRNIRGLQYCLFCNVFFDMLVWWNYSVVSYMKICREIIAVVMVGTVFT
jgi:hypothetical protein